MTERASDVITEISSKNIFRHFFLNKSGTIFFLVNIEKEKNLAEKEQLCSEVTL